MNLTLSTIREITCGAVRVEQAEQGIRFYRFSEKELEMYQQKNKDFAVKALTTAGMRLRFRTNSKTLGISVLFQHPIGRHFFSVDVFANGKNIGYVDNFCQEDMPRQYFDLHFPEGIYEKTFTLEDDCSLVEIILPWNGVLTLRALRVDDGALVESAKPEKKILVYGDSITQGYDAMRPSNRYAGRIAAAMDAEEFNKAIGGECFCPELADEKVDFEPDYILVAYGTNDWSKSTRQVFLNNSKAFYHNLAKNYPGVPILAVTPIWRIGAESRVTGLGAFSEVEPGIVDAVAGLEQVTVLRGIDFVPHDINCFSDSGLHPNDVGFCHYADSLWAAILESGVIRDRF